MAPPAKTTQTQFTFGGFTAPAATAFKPPAPDKADRDKKVAAQLRDVDALFGRVTYNAGPMQARYSTYPGTGVTPEQIWNITLLRNTGYPQLWTELTEQTLERDGHLGGITDTRRLSVTDKEFRVHPARRGDYVAEILQRVCERAVDKIDDFEQTCEDLLSAPAYGYGSGEIVWDWTVLRVPVGGERSQTVHLEVKLPRQVDWVHWKHFRFDRYTDEPYLWLTGGEYSLPPHKFIFHKASGTGLIEKRGFMGSCNWLAAAKRWSERDWLVYAKIFGIPQIIAKYPNGMEEYETHRNKYMSFLRDWGEGIPALLPDDLQFEISREAGGRAGDVHGSIVGWANTEMSKRILGSTLTVEVSGQGAWAAADTHRDAPFMRARADAKKLSSTLRRDLFTAIVEENVWVLAQAIGVTPDEILDAIPRCSWRIEREMTARDRHAVYEGAVNELGMEIDEDQYRDEFGMDRPRQGGRALSGRAQVKRQGEVVVSTTEAVNDPDPEPVPDVRWTDGDPQRALPPGRPRVSRDTKEELVRFIETLAPHARYELLPVAQAL